MKTLTIAGREWRPVGHSTIDHDKYMVRRAQAAGVTELATRAGESPEQYGARLLDHVMDGGYAFELLGGLLLPTDIEDNDWTEKQAAETAKFMRRLTDPKDKELLLSMIVSLLIGFFEGALVSLSYSGSSLKHPDADERVQESRTVPVH